MQLRDYQEKLITDIRGQFQDKHKRVLAVMPTGAGKTATTAEMIKRTAARGKKCLFTVHRQELMDQSIAAFNEAGIEHGCIAAGYDSVPDKPVQLASIETLRRRLDKTSFRPDFVVVDEAAHSCSETWRFVIEHFGGAHIIGLTATPERLDGKGLGSVYQSMVQGPTTAELIDRGYLSQYEYFAPTQPDLTDVRTRLGDFDIEQAAGIMDTPRITGDAIREYAKHCDGKRAVAFCVSVKHSQNTAENFARCGYRALHIDGNTPKSVRRQAISDFRSGIIQILTSVDIFSEGFDLPAVECAILLRPTQSLSMYLQQVGRALRVSPGKEKAIILDHAGNVNRHWLPDEERTWSLAGRKKMKRADIDAESEVKIRQCPECYCNHKPAPICPACQFEYPIKSREIEIVDGELTQFVRGKRSAPKVFDSGIAEAKTRDELEALARDRGYKNPTVWAEIRLSARTGKKPNFAIAMSRRKLYA